MSPTQPLLVVLAATGFQGSSVISYFLEHEPTYRIRGTTRNTTTDAALALQAKGVEIVQVDTNDLASLQAAFTGATAIFAYTDFAGCIKQVMQSGEVSDAEGSVAEKAARVEVQQGKNIADAAAKTNGLERLVWSNLIDVKGRSGGKYSKAVHFDSKVEVWRYMKTLQGLEGKVSAVVMGTFADNAVKMSSIFRIVKESESHYVYHSPIGGSTVVPFIDVEKDTGAFVSALIKAPGGLQVLGTSEPLASEEWLALWARENRVQAKHVRTAIDTATMDDKLGMGQALVDIFAFTDEFGYTGSDRDVLTPEDFETKTGVRIPRTEIANHIMRENWTTVL